MEKFTGWAKTKSPKAINNWIMYFRENKPQYGIDYKGIWQVNKEDGYISYYEEEVDYPATDREVESALIAEAEKRGFKDGVWYKSASFGDNNQASGRLVYNKTNNTLYFDGGMLGLLFESGQWAEIIPEEKKSIKISEMPDVKYTYRDQNGEIVNPDERDYDGNPKFTEVTKTPVNPLLKDVEDTFAKCLTIVKKKNADYAGENSDPYKNFKNSLFVGVEPKRAILVRLTDKMSRISNLLNQETNVKDEAIEDTIDDAINYFAILKSFIKNENRKEV